MSSLQRTGYGFEDKLTQEASRLIYSNLDSIIPTIDMPPEQTYRLRSQFVKEINSAVDYCKSKNQESVSTKKLADILKERGKYFRNGRLDLAHEMMGLYFQLRQLAQSERLCNW